MISDRGRGVVLYALSAVLLLAAGVWYVRAAPAGAADPRVRGWRADASNLLPDLPFQIPGDTSVLVSNANINRTAPVDGGSYQLSMVCFGLQGDVRVRLSSAGNDSGRAVPCAEAPELDIIMVGLAGEVFLNLVAEIDGGNVVVFRWRLDRTRGF